jgi:aspartyl-tRNA(Asn)/glutamyl-tRNA(Gln) amidotransferase subunit B
MTQTFTSDVVIGLEIHAELNTNTKLFCSCSREEKEGEEPNSRCCPVCLGMPGSKPVLNKKALEYALKLALALKCDISKELIFSRKSYFYPDLAKNYQISQYEIPLGNGGELNLASGKTVKLTRVHMEEDPASLVHTGDMKSTPFVLVDYNRSGNPLCEIVTQPDMTSADEARDFMKQLITVLEYLEIFDINKCIVKADANISVKESGYVRAEIKNITGFKEIERALNYEILRQKNEVKEGRKLVVETRGWDAESGSTYTMRTKESEEDYGYIIDPDLTITDISDEMVNKVRSEMPELAGDKLKKFLDQHKLEETTANVLAKDKKLADMYESVIKEVNPDLAAKWIRRELPRVLNYNKKSLDESGIMPEHMVALLKLIQEGKITEKIGQRLIEKLGESSYNVTDHVQKEGLAAVADTGEIEKFCKEAISEAPQAVVEYKSGKEKSINFIVGLVMRKSKGKAKPDVVLEILKKLLA